MQIYGFGINPLDQFNGTANKFTLFDPELGRNLDMREWTKVHGGTPQDFYGIQRDILGGMRDAIFARDIKSAPLDGIDVFDAIKTYSTVNASAVQQVLDSFGNWQDFMKIVNGDTDAPMKSVFGFDLETFGDIQNGKGVFGITEIALGRREYSTEGARVAGRMAAGGSIAVGIQGDSQKNYISGLIQDFRQGKWADMSEYDKVTLRRLTRYAGNYHDIFADGQSIDIIPGKFTVVKQLSDETLTIDAMESGFKNLQQVANNQNPIDVLRRVGNWFAERAKDSDSLFYGANSAYDFDSLANALRQIDFDKGSIESINKMKAGALDTVYLMRAGSALNNESVKNFMKNITGSFVGATVDEQIRAFALGLEQSHFGFADIANEGELVDYYARSTFSQLFADKTQLSSTVQDKDVAHTAFRIKYGQLNQADGREFGYTPSFEGNKYGEIDHNLSIVGDTWMVDMDRTGVIRSQVDGKDDIYAATFKNVADEVMGGEAESTRFVITSNSLEGLRERVNQIIGSSELYDLPNTLDIDDPKVQMILAGQEQRYADLGRREFAKFFDAGSSRVNNGAVTTGYNRLHQVLEFESAFQEYLEANPSAQSGKDAVNQLITFHNEYAKTHDKVLFSRTQAQTYLGMRPRIVNEYDLLKTIDDTIAKAYQGQSGIGVDMEKTAIASRIYIAASNILSADQTQYSWMPRVQTLLENNSVDIRYTTMQGTEGVFRVNAYNAQSASNDVKRFLAKTPISVAGYNQIIEDLQARNIIPSDFARVTDSLELEPYFAGQTLGSAIANGIANDKVSVGNRLLTSQRFDQVHTVIDPVTGSPVALGQIYSMSEDYRKAIADKADEILAGKHVIRYQTLNPSSSDENLKFMISGEGGLLDALNMRSGDAVKDDEVGTLFSQMFVNPNKKYAIANRMEDGVQAFIVNPGNINADLDKGQSAYLLLTNQRHVGNVMQLLESEEMQDSFRSYQKLRSSVLSQHAVIAELPRIHKWAVGQGSGINFIQAVEQGEDFFKILTPQLRTFTGDDGRLNVSFEDPAYQMASLMRKFGGRMMDYARDDEFGRGSDLYRRGMNSNIKYSPSFTTRHADGTLHFNTNEAMRAFEVNLHQGLTDVFDRLVMTPTPGSGGQIDGMNLNTAQRVVDAFGKAKGYDVRRYNNDYGSYLRAIMRDGDFQEIFHSRMMYGKVNTDGFFGSYLPNTPEFSKPIYDIMQDLIESEDYRDTLKVAFNTDERSFFSVINTFKQLKELGALDAVGSESSVAHGSYFLHKYGSFRPQSNLYSMMRPPYIQQGNAYTYDLNSMLASKDNFKMLNGEGLDAVYFGMNNMSTLERNLREAMNQNNPNVVIDEGQFLGKVKTIGDYDIKKRFESLLSDETGLNKFNELLREAGSSETIDMATYQNAIKAIRDDLGYVYEDALWIAPALKDTPLFQNRDAIGYSFGNMSRIDIDATRKRLYDIVNENGGIVTSDTVIGKTNSGREIYFGKSDVRITKDDIETLLSGDKAKLTVLGHGDIIDDKIIVNGMEKGTTRTINYHTLFDRLDLDAARQISQFGLNDTSIEGVSRDFSNYIFDRLTDNSLVAGNFKYTKHGGVVGLHNAWNLIQLKYTEAARENDEIGISFAEYLNGLAEKVGEQTGKNGIQFQWDPVRKRFYGNDDLLQNPSRFYQALLDDVFNDRTMPRKDIGELNQRIKSIYDELAEKNIGFAVLQRQIMNEHMGTKFTIDQRLEQGLRFQGLHNDGVSYANDIDNQLVDALKRQSLDYDGRTTDMLFTLNKNGNRQKHYGALELIQSKVGLAKGHERARYNVRSSDAERSIKGISESVDFFLNPKSRSEIAGMNILEIDVNDLLHEVNRSDTITREDLMESIFFVDGKPSDFLKRMAQKKEKLDIEHDSYSIFVDFGNLPVSVDNTTKLNHYLTPDKGVARTNIDGILIPIYSGTYLDDNMEQIHFMKSQSDTATLLRKISDIMTKHPEDSNQTGWNLGTVIRDYYEKLDQQTAYLTKKSELYKFAQTWTIPHSHQFLSQDQVAPLLGMLDENELEKLVNNGRIDSSVKDKLMDEVRKFQTQYDEANRLKQEIKKYSQEHGDDILKGVGNHSDFFKMVDDLGQAQSILKVAEKELRTQIFEVEGNKEIAGAVLRSAGISNVLDLASREAIDGKLVTGLAVAVSEQGLEGMGLSMADVAQSIVSDYERAGGLSALTDSNLTIKSINGKHSIDMIDEFFGTTIDERFNLVEGIEKAENIRSIRSSFMQESYDKLRGILETDQRTLITSYVDDIGGEKPISLFEAADNRLRELIAGHLGEDTKTIQGLSIRDLNKRIKNGNVFINGLPKDIREFYEGFQDAFKQSGIAQAYMSEIGIQGLLTRFPVFNLQPWVKVVLDQNMQSYQIRASNPIINKLIHLDNDGDTLMLGILANGSSLHRREGKDDIVGLFNQVYRRNLGTYVEGMASEAFKDFAPYTVDDVSNYIKQEASLLEIIDGEGYNAALKEYLGQYASARKLRDPDSWIKNTLKNIKSDANAGILEAALNSPVMDRFYQERIKSTLTNENALIAATVARIRKDYIGYVSTPNYKVRETLNQTYRHLQQFGGKEEQLSLLRKTMLGLTSFNQANGGLFSVIEQKIIDPKHAHDGLTPIGVKNYSAAMSKLMSSHGNREQADRAMRTLISTIGEKALDIESDEEAKIVAEIICKTSLTEYEDLIEALSKVQSSSMGKFIGDKNYELTSDYASILKNAKAFKYLYDSVQVIDEVSKTWDFVKGGTFSGFQEYFKDYNKEDTEKLLRMLHGLGFDEDIYGLIFGEEARSAKLPPFKRGHVYFQTDGGRGELKGATKGWVYQGNDTFQAIDASGNINPKVTFKTRDASLFDRVTIDTPTTHEAYINDPAVKTRIDTAVTSSKLEKHLNDTLFVKSGLRKRTLPDVNQNVAVNLDSNPNMPITRITKHLVGNDWQATRERLEQDIRAYNSGLGVEIDLNGHHQDGISLLRDLNRRLAQSPYRDMAAIGPNTTAEEISAMISEMPTLADAFHEEVLKQFGGQYGQGNYDNALNRANLLPKDFSSQEFLDRLDNFSRRVYNVDEEISLLEKEFAQTADELNILKGQNADASTIKGLERLLANKDTNIRNLRKILIDRNTSEISIVQDGIYEMLSPKGTTKAQFETYATQVFRWNTPSVKDSMVGFGLYTGQRFENLSASDIKAIRSEAEALAASATKNGTTLPHQLDFSIKSTLQRLQTYTDSSPAYAAESALKKRSEELGAAILANREAVDVAIKQNDAAQQVKGAKDAINAANRMKKQTISGGIFDKVKDLNITGKQVATIVGTMAALGVTNKLLHKRKKSPLEAAPSGGSAAPIINGHRQEQAPPSPSVSTGSRTIYHDDKSGLDFKVSARTKKRLDANGYSGVVNRAGGGSASVHVYNDTSGVSDNWLSNKFSELAE